MSSGSEKVIAEIPVNEDGILCLSGQEAKVILENIYKSNIHLDYIYEDPSNDADKQSGDATTADLMDVSNESTEKSTNRFKDVTVEDTDAFLHENINKNTAYKTKTYVQTNIEWLQQYGEERLS
jgi:hypothetical protein